MKTTRYFGGIRTIDDMKQRCTIDDASGCWIWKGSMSNARPAVQLLDPDTGKYKHHTGTKASALLSGRKIGPKQVAYRIVGCPHRLCVNPAHIKVGTKTQSTADAVRLGLFKGNPAKVAAITRQGRAMWAKLDTQKALEIRLSDEPTKTLAERYGVKPTTIRAVRAGKCWRDAGQEAPTVVGASVFTWRG